MATPAMSTPGGREPSRKGNGTCFMRNTRGTAGASWRIRRTASSEKLITRTGPSGSPAQPKCSSSSVSRRSTSPPYRVGCLVSIATSTRRSVSATRDSSFLRVSRWERSSVLTTSGSSSPASSRAFHEPQSRPSSSVSSRVETRPRPLEVRRTERSCTQTRCPSAVSRTSHSSAVGSRLDRLGVGGQRVLGFVRAGATVSDHQGTVRSHPARLPQRSVGERHSGSIAPPSCPVSPLRAAGG